ncbi:MAG TPA: glycosyl hydrolase [Glycomyces sp.]|nr:glycosyl hydrolase [Glycomyces sp.]
MDEANAPQGAALRTGRGLAALLAAVPLVLVGFVAGYGLGSGQDRETPTVPAWDAPPGQADHPPTAATYIATAGEGAAPAEPAALPVGNDADLGIAVTHLQFHVDESTAAPDDTAELRLPVLVAPDGGPMTVEVSSVRAVPCLCSLTAEAAPPYGRVWDSAVVDAATTEVVLDVTGAIDAPGRHAFAISTPDTEGYLEFEGTRRAGAGPALRTAAVPEPATGVPGGPAAEPDPSPTADAPRPEAGQAEDALGTCTVDRKLVPACGVLVGAAAGAHTALPKEQAFLDFEQDAGRTQQIYHAYERADERLFPTPEQIALTEDPERPRTLFINWKPQQADWAAIAQGDPATDAYLLDLAEHIKANFDKPFFFTVHHEPENDVVDEPGSGMEPDDYAEMFRYVVEFLRAQGVDNLVTVMNYMGYLKWVEMPWHDRLYPGDDVVDWIGVSGYGQSLADDGHSDFAEIVDQTNDGPWPGFYHWIGEHHPSKPMMLAEWGVFHESDHPGHQRTVFASAAEQFAHYPRLKAIVYFSSPDAEGRNSEITTDPEAHRAFQDLMASRHFTAVL